MIYCTERKIGIFLNPRTGSKTIYNIFKGLNVTHNKHNHINYEVAVDAYNIADFNTYKFFCFYRDPVDRLISTIKYFKRIAYISALSNFSTIEHRNKAILAVKKRKYDDYLFMQKTYPNEFDWLDQEQKDIINGISIKQILDIIPNDPNEISFTSRNQSIPSAAFSYQKRWLDFNIDLTMLNFADFENETRRLFSHFNVTLDEIPNINANLEHVPTPQVTEEERAAIILKFKPDYDFFASKGIAFQ